MIFRTETFKTACSNILSALDSSASTEVSALLQIKQADEHTLALSVTNNEYFVTVKMPVTEAFSFPSAITIGALQFLKLISKCTTDSVEIDIVDKYVKVKANGEYKFPLVFGSDGNVLNLPEISIGEVTSSFEVNSDTLASVLKYNGRELTKVSEQLKDTRAIYRLIYLDDKGAVSFTTGACVNDFAFPTTLKLLLPEKIVRLFKLLPNATNVGVDFGVREILDSITQSQIKFVTPTVEITAVLPNNDKLLTAVPVGKTREFANTVLPYSATINKAVLLSAITRLQLFVDGADVVDVGTFEFHSDRVVIYDNKKNNQEVILFDENVAGLTEPFTCKLRLTDLKLTAETCDDHFVLNFGAEQSVNIIVTDSVTNILATVQ